MTAPKPFFVKPGPVARAVIQEVAEAHDVEPTAMLGSCRAHHLAHARHEAMHRLRALGWSLPRIGAVLGGLHHTSALYGIRAHEKRQAEGRA